MEAEEEAVAPLEEVAAAVSDAPAVPSVEAAGDVPADLLVEEAGEAPAADSSGEEAIKAGPAGGARAGADQADHSEEAGSEFPDHQWSLSLREGGQSL